MTQNRILDQTQILQKITRIAYQIYENNFDEQAIVFAGIQGTGYTFAQMLQKEFRQLSPIPANLAQININKTDPAHSPIQLEGIEEQDIKNKVIIICDDVLNTGRTIAYSLRCFVNTQVRKIQTVVLVDRQHPLFPIAADYVGYQLSTTLQEHISVVLDQELSVFLY